MAAATFMLCRALLAMALLAGLPGQSGVRAHVTPSEVRISTTMAGAARALTEQDMAELVRDNLEPDLQPWQAATRPGSNALSALDFLELVHQIDTQWPEYRRNFVAIVTIRSGRISWWAYPNARKWCTSRVQYMQDELDKHTINGGIPLPDTVFVMNAYDKPLCPTGTCAAPIFSFNKPWLPQQQRQAQPQQQEQQQQQDSVQEGTGPSTTQGEAADGGARRVAVSTGAAAAAIRAPGEGPMSAATAATTGRTVPAQGSMAAWGPQAQYDDVLFPVLNHPFDHLVHFPWEEKNDTAFMRAGLYPAMDARCARVRICEMSEQSTCHARLDVGIYKNRHWKVKLPIVAPVPMEEHARWRFLLNADGQGASWRLAKLLAIDSVVLKFQSTSIEYYYRSLVQGKHYVPLDDNNFCSAIQSLQALTDHADLQAITRAAQDFAYRYLSQASRCAYASLALRRYTQLFSDMPRLLQELEGRSPSVQVLLDIRSRWLGGSSTGASSRSGATALSSNIPGVRGSAQEPAAVAAPNPRAVFRVRWTRLPSDGVRAGQPEGRRQGDVSGAANAALIADGGAQQQQQQQQRVWGVSQQWRQSRLG